MKTRILLVTTLVVSLAALGTSLWALTRPSTAAKLTQNADSMLNQWKFPSTAPTKMTTTAPQEKIPSLHSAGWGVISIPAINITLPLIEGINEYTDLNRGIGHYSVKQEPYIIQNMPGQIGNFAVAGHVNGPFAPFANLYKLRTGNTIIITTRVAKYTYTVITATSCGPSQSIVHMSKVAVIFPNPCSNTPPTARLMTLTTCAYPNGEKPPAIHRRIVFAELKSVTLR